MKTYSEDINEHQHQHKNNGFLLIKKCEIGQNRFKITLNYHNQIKLVMSTEPETSFRNQFLRDLWIE